MSRGPYVAVVGAGVASADELAAAEEVGRGLAAAGAVVVTGGLGGVMEAASRGAASAGGLVVGVLPGADRAAANRWVGVALPTGLGEGRNLVLVRSADVVVAVGGEWGTLSEIALALKAGTPVVGLGTWELSRAGRRDASIAGAQDPADAVRLALGAIS